MKQKSLAIPIRRVDYSNSSQVVSLFTREFGLVEGIAKGAHRPKSPFQGPFDLAVLYEVLFIERHSGGLSILTEASVVDGFRGARGAWDRYIRAAHVLEFLRAVATAGAPEPELFDLAAATLLALSRPGGPELDWLLARFDTRALRILGLLAAMDSCASCGRAWPGEGRPVFFSARLPGLLCRTCRGTRPEVAGVSIPAGALRLLESLAEPEGAWREVVDVELGWRALGRPVERVISELRTNLLERDFVLLESRRRWL
ncbi:MAG TPA: DNA repair protein RecO [Planctomycetota bacterium]|nr:DNA repair protein RecO [Planctomycetota bacterium]